MKYTNEEMAAMLESLKGFMDRRDMIGYAAARNARKLSDEVGAFLRFRDDLVVKYGDEERDAEGNATGRFSISALSPNFKRFAEEIAPISKLEFELELLKLPYEEAIGKLSGSELLALDWMFEE